MKLRYKICCLLFSLIVAAPLVRAAEAYNAIWGKANRYYQARNYDSAAILYERLAQDEPANAQLYYNLGNTYYRLNQIGRSVLNYERALKFDPDYRLAKDNLALAQSRIPNSIRQTKDIFFVSWWKQATAASRAGLWSVVALIFFVFSLSIWALRRFGKAAAWMLPQVATGALVLSIGVMILAYVSSMRASGHDRAVVMDSDLQLLEAQSKGAHPVLLPEGTVVTIDEQQNERVHVRLPDGRSGWVRAAGIEKI